MADQEVKKENKAPGELPGQAPAPAPRDRRGNRAVSGYKQSLMEKQSLKRLYGLSEKQLKRYVQETLEKMQKVDNVSDELIRRLEKRLDNAVFRAGMAVSRAHARQMVNHAYFLVNGKPVNIPSFELKKGDTLQVKENKKKKAMLKELPDHLKKVQTHAWLELDKDKMAAKAVADPSLAEVNPPVEISMVFEFYSR